MSGEFHLGEPCPYCGETYFYDLHEVYPEDRAWQFETCCEDAYEFLLEGLDEAVTLDPRERREYLKPLLDLFLDYGVLVRNVYRHCDWFRLDWGLEVRPIEWATARDFVGDHHRHNVPPRGWRFGFGIWNRHQGAFPGEETLVGVAIVGRPVARAFDPQSVVEVTRLCIDDTLEPDLVWNACSMLYAAAAREARKRHYRKVITYTLETETGHALKASGWTVDGRTKGGSWDTPSRRRTDKAPICRKIRWVRQLAA